MYNKKEIKKLRLDTLEQCLKHNVARLIEIKTRNFFLLIIREIGKVFEEGNRDASGEKNQLKNDFKNRNAALVMHV